MERAVPTAIFSGGASACATACKEVAAKTAKRTNTKRSVREDFEMIMVVLKDFKVFE